MRRDPARACCGRVLGRDDRGERTTSGARVRARGGFHGRARPTRSRPGPDWPSVAPVSGARKQHRHASSSVALARPSRPRTSRCPRMSGASDNPDRSPRTPPDSSNPSSARVIVSLGQGGRRARRARDAERAEMERLAVGAMTPSKSNDDRVGASCRLTSDFFASGLRASGLSAGFPPADAGTARSGCSSSGNVRAVEVDLVDAGRRAVDIEKAAGGVGFGAAGQIAERDEQPVGGPRRRERERRQLEGLALERRTRACRRARNLSAPPVDVVISKIDGSSATFSAAGTL